MRKLTVVGFLVCVSLIAFGCKRKADASSEEAFKKSITEMKEGLDSAKQDQLDEAIMTLSLKNVMPALGNEAEQKKKMKEVFDGKTADEIIAEGEKAKAESKAEMQKFMQGQCPRSQQ